MMADILLAMLMWLANMLLLAQKNIWFIILKSLRFVKYERRHKKSTGSMPDRFIK